jgi:tetratricopeptide (TPR) repeat protein
MTFPSARLAPAIADGRAAFDRRAWRDACRSFGAADAEAGLPVEDLERFATAAYLIADDAASEATRTRAHRMHVDAGDVEGAARCAFWLAFGLLNRGAHVQGLAWVARGKQLLDNAGIECALRGYLRVPEAIQRVVGGEPDAALTIFTEVGTIADRFDDGDLAVFALHGRGRSLLRLGRIAEGLALLDAAMVAVTSDGVSPMLAGDIYCSVLEGCFEIFDLRRAAEWTAALARWCASQPELVRYRGECLVYRARVRQHQGAWDDAMADARQACAVLASPTNQPALGAAWYQVADLHRLRGEVADADAAYRRASQCGRSPEPGLSMMRFERGDVATAVAAIRGALSEPGLAPRRAQVLRSAVPLLIAAGDVAAARGAA